MGSWSLLFDQVKSWPQNQRSNKPNLLWNVGFSLDAMSVGFSFKILFYFYLFHVPMDEATFV
jgi:hypothetical protein